MHGPSIDRVIFWVALPLIVGVSVPLVLFPVEGEALLSAAFGWLTRVLGWAYLWFTIARLRNPRLLRPGQVRERAVRWTRCQARVFAAQLDRHDLLCRDRRQRPLLGYHRVGILLHEPALRYRAAFRSGNGVGGDLRAVSLGIHGLGHLLHPKRFPWPTSSGTAGGLSCACRRLARV